MSRLTNFSDLVADIFIETGTYHGETLINAAKAGYKILYSIEFNSKNFKIAQKNCKKFKNVKILQGSSPRILPDIIDVNFKTVFWLDAHYQGQSIKELDPRYGECPLLHELKVILAVVWKKPITILIDDVHIFKECPFSKAQWPKYEVILELLKDFKCQIKEDILYAHS